MGQGEMISVIVPVYNVAQYLPVCLNSIIHQTYQNLEIILVDDGSTDSSGAVCEKYAALDSRVTVIHQDNMGVAAARNAGIKIASGAYVAFVDSDDWIEHDTYEALLDQIGTGDVITAGCWKSYLHGEDKITEKLLAGTYSSGEQLKSFYSNMLYSDGEVFDDLLASIWNKLFRLELVKRFYQQLDLSLRCYEDAAFVYTFFLHCKSIVVSKGSYYHYRIRDNSVVNSTYRFFLKDVNHLYIYLDGLFSKHAASEQLQAQLQKWIVELVLYGINEKMGFREEVKLPAYWISDQEQLIGKKLILYGAGKIGRAYRKSLAISNIEPLVWVDQAYIKLQNLGLPVESPEKICSFEFDYILIAVKEEEMAQVIRKDLETNGIANEKILWKRPVMLY